MRLRGSPDLLSPHHDPHFVGLAIHAAKIRVVYFTGVGTIIILMLTSSFRLIDAYH